MPMLASLIFGLILRTSSVLAAWPCNFDHLNITDLLPHLNINDYCVENRNILFKTGLVDGSFSSNDSSIDSNFLFCWEGFTNFTNFTNCSDVAEAYNLTLDLIDKYTEEMETAYTAEKAADALPFNELPLGVKTVLVSVDSSKGRWFNQGQFWGYIKANDFEGAVYELLNFYGDGISSARLRSEANVMTASLGCAANLDCVFLVDESGSVSKENFNLTLDWIAELVESFDESSLDQTDINIGTRFGVATFSVDEFFVDEFFLNTYATTDEYTDHILSIHYAKGSNTHLGAALTQIGVSQFTEPSGMRSASVGIPRLLIVLTDGKADYYAAVDVVAGVASLDGLNLNIIAIGIDNYDLAQLEDITTNDKIYTIEGFTQLSTILDGVMTQTCYVPTQLTIGDIIEDVSTEEGFTKYFQFETSGDIDQNTVLDIDTTQGCVYVFVSYCSQYPSYYVNDVQFISCGQPSKQIVLSPTLSNCSEYEGDFRRRLQATDTVFVAFEGRSAESAVFDMTVDVCDATSCTCAVGTNYDESLNNDGPYDISQVVIEGCGHSGHGHGGDFECRECITSCAGLADGDYPSCQGCGVYASCVGGSVLYDGRPCAPASPPLVWDDAHRRCDYSTFCETNCGEHHIPPTCGDCVSDCNGVRDGDYASCHSRFVYASCANGYLFDSRPCAATAPGTPPLVWDDYLKRCEWYSLCDNL